MLRLVFGSFLCFSCATLGQSNAQESGVTRIEQTDISQYQVVEEEEEMLTLQALEAQEVEARGLFDQGNCVSALPKIVEFADNANRLGNIVRQGVEPFYDATRDDQEVIARDPKFGQMIKAESTSNLLISKRNEFWVMEAKCLIANGDNTAAVNRLYRALEHIDGKDERDLWEEARTLIWEAVGFRAQ